MDLLGGVEAQAAAALVAAGLAAYGLAALGVAARGLRRRYEDAWSTAACGVALLCTAIVVLRHGATILPSPLGALAAASLAGGLVAPVLFVALRAQQGLDKLRFHSPIPDLPPEERRKVPHLAMGGYAMFYVFLGHVLLIVLVAVLPAATDASSRWWSDAWSNLLTMRDAPWHIAGVPTGLAGLLLLVFVLAPIELVRLAFPSSKYPWKRVIESRLRAREFGLFGGHMHMAAGATAAAAILAIQPDWSRAAMATFAALLVAVFADALSAIVGIRFGRRKLPHNPRKSYAGTIAGTVAALALAIPLVGIPMALLTAAYFLVVDVAAPVPVAVSDNLLIPIGLALLYMALGIAPLVHLP